MLNFSYIRTELRLLLKVCGLGLGTSGHGLRHTGLDYVTGYKERECHSARLLITDEQYY